LIGTIISKVNHQKLLKKSWSPSKCGTKSTKRKKKIIHLNFYKQTLMIRTFYNQKPSKFLTKMILMMLLLTFNKILDIIIVTPDCGTRPLISKLWKWKLKWEL